MPDSADNLPDPSPSAEPANGDPRPAALALVDEAYGARRRRRADREPLANFEHQLRSSIAAIRGAVEVLQSGAKDRPADRDRFLAHIARETTRLERLAPSMVLLARAHGPADVAAREAVALRPVLDGIAATAGLAHPAPVAVACPAKLLVATNLDLLEHALLNLTENAALHGGGGPVRIVAGEAAGQGRVAIEIHDDGPGIPEVVRRGLAERPVAGVPDAAGNGLGLSIAVQAVEAIGGTLELAAPPAGGTIARVTVPGAGAG